MDDFDVFVRAHGPSLAGVAYLLCGHTQTAEDLVQNALAKAHKRGIGCRPRTIRKRMSGRSWSVSTSAGDDSRTPPRCRPTPPTSFTATPQMATPLSTGSVRPTRCGSCWPTCHDSNEQPWSCVTTSTSPTTRSHPTWDVQPPLSDPTSLAA